MLSPLQLLILGSLRCHYGDGNKNVKTQFGKISETTAEDVSAFGQHRKFPPHARKASGTQGKDIVTELG